MAIFYSQSQCTTDCHYLPLIFFWKVFVQIMRARAEIGALHLEAINFIKNEVTVNNFGTLCHVNISNKTLSVFCSDPGNIQYHHPQLTISI